MASREKLLKLAKVFVDRALDRGLCLRLAGGLGIYETAVAGREVLVREGRIFQDIDFVASSADVKGVLALFKDSGFRSSRQIEIVTEGRRLFLKHTTRDLLVDVFFDKMEFCHTLALENRLGISYPALSIEDLLLSKLQMIQLATKDALDLAAILLECCSRGHVKEALDLGYIGGLLAKDWGFWYTSSVNLQNVKEFSFLGENELARATVVSGALRAHLSKMPKSLRWHVRSLFGTRLRWYEEVSSKGEAF